MKKEEIHLSDWQRILLGEVPGSFYVELLIRVAVVYLILLVSMRLMGKRMASQLSRTEMIAMVSLAASIGVPALAPDRGLFPAVISAFVIVAIQRLLAIRTAQNVGFETLVQGDMSVLVSNSVLQLDAMETARITRERLFAQLRSNGLYHLGQVKYLFMESDGKFTLVQEPEPQPGLSVLPGWDRDYTDKQNRASNRVVCQQCGQPESAPTQPDLSCANCGDRHWQPAVQ
ncbi:DUF421 domain-containing protein [Rudanella paleaurantiibacter]|uniref:DUF421 domain-containing protein n=1 Tax=Rudanella paleaurantiibacter TaxID=2614655 RepID=A0A7J5U3W3_9BACT|nr:YetF domain-containing protein [Rudanella paleaurantiibacter]KAB7732539.1 DUF421 domain-containing protein [Rudanella paleaurantiibacter]